MPRGTWGLSAVESNRLERALRFFLAGLKGYASGKNCRAHRLFRLSGAAMPDRYGLTGETPLTGSLCQSGHRQW